MDPVTGTWATIGAALSLLVSVAGWLRYKRSKREKLGQAVADDLKRAIDTAERSNDPPLKLRVDKDS